ncbi:MAG: GNAT family N-acetyltransferase, partial [Chloroflexota bacterium]
PNPMHELDGAPLAIHLGAFADDQLIGVVSTFKQALPPEDKVAEAWCVWGLSVDQKFAEQGYEDALLQACIGYAATNTGEVIWHRASATDVAIYERNGFKRHIAPEEPSDSDAIILMTRRLYRDDVQMQAEGTF